MTKKSVAILLSALAAFLMLISGFFLGRRNVSGVKVSSERTVLVTAEETANRQLPDTRININTATAEQLQQLPQIGEVIAQRIIAYREQHGDFGGVSEIMNVEGIGEGRFEAIKDYITVR